MQILINIDYLNVNHSELNYPSSTVIVLLELKVWVTVLLEYINLH